MRVRTIVPFILIFAACTLSTALMAESTTHVVQSSETIYSIARDFRIAPELLMKTNDISNPRLLQVGAVLKIPSSYRVKRGDTLYGISRQFGVSLQHLLKVNGINADHLLREGEDLLIPPSDSSPAAKPVSVADIAAGRAPIPGASSMATPSNSGLEKSGHAQTTTLIGASGFEAKASADPTLKLPIAADTTPIDSSSDGPWPHAGKHYLLSGKFPGIMIRGEPGDPVTAVANGRVIYTGPYTTFGKVVFVQSADGYVYIYGGNGKVLVSPGDAVRTGTTIGSLGTVPFEQGAQLYFSVWKQNKFVDPEKAPRG
ncbi:MAG TPA: LysM peptidoglycan-binding domain-containing M23 family metallopeptidase [Spirochaetia bacterium]|nr:LysM peptidoglycan-binding domain-containing M23 family metallopeptidase [Spirochaetia bacterium]